MHIIDHWYKSMLSLLFIILEKCSSSYTPAARAEHVTTLVKNKVYFQGGLNTSFLPIHDFFWLDLDQNFSRFSPPFRVEQFTPVPVFFDAPTFVSGDNMDTIYIVGGYRLGNGTLENNNDIFVINTSSIPLNMAKVQNTSSQSWPIGLFGLQAPLCSNRRAYFWGGSEFSKNGTDNAPVASGVTDSIMHIFDIDNLSWSSVNPSGYVPEPRTAYSATCLPDGRILYLGGSRTSNNLMVDMDELLFFDPSANSWTHEYAESKEPLTGRYAHTATLYNDNLVIYGGMNLGNGTTSPEQAVMILDLKTWNWTTPRLPNAPHNVTWDHSATQYNDYVVFAFGVNVTMTNQIYIFDLKNLSWVDDYIYPHPSKSITKTTNLSSHKSKPDWIISFACVILLGYWFLPLI